MGFILWTCVGQRLGSSVLAQPLGNRNRLPKVSLPDPHKLGTPHVLYQLISLAGAFLILLAYFANNRNWMGPRDRRYHLLNLCGGLLLFWVAVVDRRAGFMVLELAWALIAVPPLINSRSEEGQILPEDPEGGGSR